MADLALVDLKTGTMLSRHVSGPIKLALPDGRVIMGDLNAGWLDSAERPSFALVPLQIKAPERIDAETEAIDAPIATFANGVVEIAYPVRALTAEELGERKRARDAAIDPAIRARLDDFERRLRAIEGGTTKR